MGVRDTALEAVKDNEYCSKPSALWRRDAVLVDGVGKESGRGNSTVDIDVESTAR
jgi:hypothetical protein